jgi:hypothetical protein
MVGVVGKSRLVLFAYVASVVGLALVGAVTRRDDLFFTAWVAVLPWSPFVSGVGFMFGGLWGPLAGAVTMATYALAACANALIARQVWRAMVRRYRACSRRAGASTHA